MDTTEISKIIFKGPENAIKRYRGEAISQLQILDTFMKFQGLVQYKRTVKYSSGVTIDCWSSFGLHVATIKVPSIPLESGKTITVRTVKTYLLVIYGNPEEYLNINYTKDSPIFISEAVECTAGSGNIESVSGTRLYGTFTMCWEAMVYGEDSHASAGILTSIERHFLRNYEKQEIVSASLIPFSLTGLDLNSSLEIQPLSDVPAQGDPRIGNEWTKTFGDFNVTAFSFYGAGDYGVGSKKWAVSASLKDTTVKWLGMDYYPPTGFSREVCKQATCDVSDSWIDVHIGFDVWSEINKETDEEELFVGLMADVESLFTIWKLNTETNTMELQSQYSSTIRDDEFDASFNPLRHVRVLGYGHSDDVDKIYWGTPGYFEGYYQEDPNSGSVVYYGTNGNLAAAIWNPALKELKICVDKPKDVDDPYIEGPFSEPSDYYVYAYYSTNWPVRLCGSRIENTSFGDVEMWGCELDGSGWPQGYDSWSRCFTGAWKNIVTETDYGFLKIDAVILDRGAQTQRDNDEGHVWEKQRYGAWCSVDSSPRSTAYSYKKEQVLYETSQKDISLNGLAISPDSSLAYSYSERSYSVTTVSDDPYLIQGVEAGDWSSHEGGNNDMKPFIDNQIPYDHNWRAVLLKGDARTSEIDETLIEKTGMMIFEDANGLHLHDGDNLTLLGSYERGFFKQIEIVTEQEIEI